MTHLLRTIALLTVVINSLQHTAFADTDVNPLRGGNTLVMTRASYDYVPSIMLENGVYRRWWCGGYVFADQILYSESTSLTAGWTTNGFPHVSLGPDIINGEEDAFDLGQTCDPSVIKVGGTYLLYYGGLPAGGFIPGNYTQIGVAQSFTPSGQTPSDPTAQFARINNAQPIIGPSFTGPANPGDLSYGVGQPSAIFLDGWFYLMYWDSTGVPGDGQYVLRSSDPTFQNWVYEYRQSGWTLLSGDPQHTHPAVPNAVSVDWTYMRAVQAFAVGINNNALWNVPARNSLKFIDKTLNASAGDRVNILGRYSEGPGIVRLPNGHARSTTNCSHHLFDIFRSDCNPFIQACNFCLQNEDPIVCGNRTRANIVTWDLLWLGWDAPTGLTSCPATLVNTFGDFSGDEKAELAVYRPSTAQWFIKDRFENSIKAYSWGLAGDIPVRGDFDRDGLSDPTVWRPSSGTFLFIASSGICPSGSTPHYLGCLFQWGLNGDVPVPRDYDGNGTTDYAVWRPSNGYWYIRYNQGSTTSTTIAWGAPTDIPTPADFDGNGTADIVVWRPSDGKWYFRATGTTSQWGTNGDIPVPGDYNNDGTTDLAVWRPSEGNWYVLAAGFPLVTQYGLPNDIPVQRDFNGDGSDDISVFRPSEGKWYVRNQGTFQWGLPGDIPLR